MNGGPRVSPQAVDAERALLGGLIKAPDMVAEIAGIGLLPDHFYRPDHGKLFQLLKTMHAGGEAIDMVTITERVVGTMEPDSFGGAAYVMGLPDQNPSTANLPYYANQVLARSMQRKLIDAAKTIEDEAYATDDVNALLTKASKDILSLSAGGTAGTFEQISLILDALIPDLQKRTESEGEVAGVPSGFADLDKMLAGLHPSDLIILAARPAMGKTALALNLALNVARSKETVALFSMEMSRAQLVTRLLSNEARMDAGKIKTGDLDTDDWTRLLDASVLLRGDRIHIDDQPGLSILDVQSRTKRLEAIRRRETDGEHGVGMVVIDYLQLMSGDDRRAPREQQIAAISRGLKALAKDLGAPVLALSQLNRGVESRADKRPMMSDLRESGAIEQDADIILFIYRDEYYNPDSSDQGLAEVIIAKHRSGPTGAVKLVFEGQYSRFSDYTSAADEFGL